MLRARLFAEGIEMNKPFDVKTFMSDFTRAANTRSPDVVLRHYADDAEISDPSTPTPLRGKAGVRENIAHWSSAFSEFEFRVKDVIQSGNKVALLLDAKARHTGALEIAPGETVGPTNRTVRMEVSEFLTISDEGKITKDLTIFDQTTMLTQLGLMEGARPKP